MNYPTQRAIQTIRTLPFSLVVLILCARPAIAAERLADERLKNGTLVRSAFIELVAEARRATVLILVEGEQVALGGIVSPTGHVLTKASELRGNLVCRLPDGRESAATLIGVHQEADLALLKIEATELPVLQWNSGGDPEVGRFLATPGIEELPIAVGIVSVGRREIPPERGVLGISIAESETGPSISQVVPNSGASKAGLQVGDIIMRAADRRVENGDALSAILKRYHPGDRISFVVRRENEELEAEATLGRAIVSLLNRSVLQNSMGGGLSTRRGGFSSVLQHDSVLYANQCGGPVVDLSGKVIGFNIARAGRTETYLLPADLIQKLLPGLLLTGMKAEKPVSRSTADSNQ